MEESSASVPLSPVRQQLYNTQVEAARVISFSQPQHVAQIIDLLAAWKRIQLIVESWRKQCKVYLNIADNGIIQYRCGKREISIRQLANRNRVTSV